MTKLNKLCFLVIFCAVFNTIKCAYDKIACMMLYIYSRHEVSSLCKGGMTSEMHLSVEEQKYILSLQGLL